MTHAKRTLLGNLKKGDKGRIVSVGQSGGNCQVEPPVGRLMDLGFLEGAPVEVVHEAPFGRDPIAVRVRGSLVALRREEANWIEVSVL